jgi:steroid 5-alpha reductase family enzyme
VGIEFMMSQPSINFFSIIGSLIILSATIIQYISDTQMQKFKSNHLKKKACIDSGLWRYSRHPNYFGEVMVWWGLYVMYLSSVQTLNYLILAPILMTSLFYFISIPLMENKILSTRPSYEMYQKKVSKLIFMPRRDIKVEETIKN